MKGIDFNYAVVINAQIDGRCSIIYVWIRKVWNFPMGGYLNFIWKVLKFNLIKRFSDAKRFALRNVNTVTVHRFVLRQKIYEIHE